MRAGFGLALVNVASFLPLSDDEILALRAAVG